MEAMQPSVELTQEVDMTVVEEIAEEAGIDNPKMLLQEAVHHDDDEDQTLSVEELKSAAEVVVAQQEVIREVEEQQTGRLPQAEPEAPQEPGVDIDTLVDEATTLLKDGNPKASLALPKPHLKTIGAEHAAAWRIAGGAYGPLGIGQPRHRGDDPCTELGTKSCFRMVQFGFCSPTVWKHLRSFGCLQESR